MKRGKLIRYLTSRRCELVREGKKHSIYINPTNRQTAPVPRHPDIDSRLVVKICKELGFESPPER